MNFFKTLFRKDPVTIEPPMDILGFALADYSESGKDAYVSVYNEHLDLYNKFPISSGVNPMSNRSLVYSAVQEACKGKILDVGACGGDFSLTLQKHGLNVTAIDVSEQCVDYMNRIGIEKCKHQDIREICIEKFDTILFMGSTIGICERVEFLPAFIDQLKVMLNLGGQLIIEDSKILDPSGYNEFTTHLKYKHYITKNFDWFNIGPQKLQELLENIGFETEIIYEHEYTSNYVLRASMD